MAKKETTAIERTYNVPLRKEFMKVPVWRKTKKAVAALRQFLERHMKSDNIKIGKEVNDLLWKHGIKNPPHHIKVNVTKDDKGVVKAELFGAKKKTAKKKETKKKEEKKTPPETKKEETTKVEDNLNK
ncbi:MAG: 50S ribosomal protein L31e [Nanoarchaeota archaeon]|nr:60S ribosomal protein L31 [Nanoarchaeota archaeon]MBU1632305.1 60S ribosomal protein L31 [Nanoarchaeota archaeon]MBU1875795.1 60S ribosomal protein L31 [Nanoarchaeota archaeon]